MKRLIFFASMLTMSISLIVLAVYYPLKEMQELEIKAIELEIEAKALNRSIVENKKNVIRLQEYISKNGKSDKSNSRLSEIKKLNSENYISQLQTERKHSEIQVRKRYVKYYNIIFWIFFPIGVLLTIFGFTKWNSTKKYDDNILKLQNEKLEIEVDRLQSMKKTTQGNNRYNDGLIAGILATAALYSLLLLYVISQLR